MTLHDYISMFDEIVLSPGFNKLVQKSCLINCVVHGLVFHLCVMLSTSVAILCS